LTKKQRKVRAEKRPPILNIDLILETAGHLAGEKGEKIVRALVDGELTDEDLAKKTNLQINQVRSILYSLHESRIVTYRREREENSGWYVYYWKVNPERAIDYLRRRRMEVLRRLEERLAEEEGKIFFTCDKGCTRVPYEEAIGMEFKCPSCNGTLQPHQNTAIINSLRARIEKLRRELA
jgi:transcription initiation factor TFIIE subunit alpha